MELPSQRIEEGLRRWPDELLPFVVLYSPILRLRFRSALQKVISQINGICKREVFLRPVEAPNCLAVKLESDTPLAPPTGNVYVRDCDLRKDKKGRVLFWKSSAIVMLPENEETPYVTLEVTTKEVFELLLMQSVQDVTKETIDLLEKTYCKQQSF